MMFLVFLALLATAVANPILINEPKPMENGISTYLAVDFTALATTAQFNCLGSNRYTVTYIRAYTPAGQGTFDNNSITVINNANRVNIGAQVYISPNPTSTKSGGDQLSETFNGLYHGGVFCDPIWLQVVSPKQWGSVASNIKFIQSYMDMLKDLGITGGIHTTSQDWSKITNNWTGAKNLKLWYSTAKGPGLTNESPNNFNDFTPFGGWTTPAVKQFALTETVCNLPVNRDIFAFDDNMPTSYMNCKLH